MGILKKIEKKLENAVEGFFAKGFKSKVEPVELGKKMALAMLNNKVVALKKVWAPNEFTINLSPEDNKQYEAYQKELADELQDFLIQEATAEGLSMIGRPKITFKKDNTLSKGQFDINVKVSEELEKEISKTKDGATELIPIEEIVKAQSARHYVQLEPSMIEYDLSEGRIVIGRSVSNNIAIPDPALSRHHFEIFIEGIEAVIKDLGSTNGTMVNEKKIKSLVLKNKDEIKAGETTLIYRRVDA